MCICYVFSPLDSHMGAFEIEISTLHECTVNVSDLAIFDG